MARRRKMTLCQQCGCSGKPGQYVAMVIVLFFWPRRLFYCDDCIRLMREEALAERAYLGEEKWNRMWVR